MVDGTPPDYTDAERERGQRRMVVEGAFARAMDGLTGGVVLAAFALHLGASDVEIGLLAAIPFLAQVAHVPAVALLSRIRDLRAVTVWLIVGARLLLFPVAALAVLDLPAPRVAVLLAILAAYAVLATLSGAAWQVWVRDLVPRARLGAYFGLRMAILSAVGLVTLVAAGPVLAWWTDHGPGGEAGGFAAFFALGGVLGLASAGLLATVPARELRASPVAGFRARLARPFRDANYRRTLLFLGAWGFAANLALPFVAVQLLRSVGYGLPVVTALAGLSLAANFAAFRLWAPVTDRFGNKPVLGLSASVFVLSVLLWAATPKTPGGLTLAAAAGFHLALGFATAGIDLASNGLAMKLAPADEGPAYLSTTSLVKAVSAGVAPLLGGVAASQLDERAFTVRLGWSFPGGEHVVTAVRFAEYDFLFLASAVFGLYAAHRLLGFQEEGEAPPEAVARALRRDVGHVSSVAGMRQFAHVASYVAEAAWKIEKKVAGRDPPGRGGAPPGES